MIGCHRQDLATWEWAKDINGVLEHELPDARSRIARAKTAGRLASLIGTDQLDTAVLSQADAKAMRSGSDGFEPYGAIDIKAVANLTDYVYVVRSDFPNDHARLLADALTHLSAKNNGVIETADPAIPWHPGVGN